MDLYNESSAVKLDLIRPALVEEAGGRWTVVRKGEVADAERVNKTRQPVEELPRLDAAFTSSPNRGKAAAEEREAPQKLTRADVEAALAHGVSLRDKDLSGLDLSNLRFEGIDLAGSNLSKTRNENTVYESSRLEGANFSDAVFRNSTIERVFAVNSRWDRAQFDQTSIVFSNFVGAKFRGAVFRDTARSVDPEERPRARLGPLRRPRGIPAWQQNRPGEQKAAVGANLPPVRGRGSRK
jgi:hypothetical protein